MPGTHAKEWNEDKLADSAHDCFCGLHGAAHAQTPKACRLAGSRDNLQEHAPTSVVLIPASSGVACCGKQCTEVQLPDVGIQIRAIVGYQTTVSVSKVYFVLRVISCA